MEASPSSSDLSSSLDSLPVELLMDIIESACGSASDDEEAMFGGDDARLPIQLLPFRMSSVCRRWRDHILNVPRAWQRVYLSFRRERLLHAESAAKQTQYLDFILSRAGAAPLHVFVGGAPGTVQDYHRALLDVLCDILPRAQRLSVWTAMETITHRSIFEELALPTPLLQYLSVNSDEFSTSDPAFTRIPLFYDSPRLEELRLCGVKMSFIDCTRYPSLRSLKLSSCAFNPAILAHMGHWWPLIEHVSLESIDSGPWPTTPPPMAPLPRLRSLDTYYSVMAPTLPVYSICIPEFFQYSVRNLQELTLRSMYLSECFVHDVLIPCKHLRALHLHNSTFSQDFWGTWTATPSAAPALRALSFDECQFPDDSGLAFVAFLRERRPGATTSSSDASCAGIDTLRIAQIPQLLRGHILRPNVIKLVRAVVPAVVIQAVVVTVVMGRSGPIENYPDRHQQQGASYVRMVKRLVTSD
ncbi:hypothetical protein EXIGLDRAFT_834851 [Exidia glandulosa HHB12029]|uniref:Uncharacterized protein n=1 Tax=Exidia glandulosa HHB12029 TaxID=1314781 RepID=A0A166AS49_EXIGL|nr:hypothetical protein EXIGLDRAFT_834851 [Exidia glandulosa HHB12029]